ncbi:unnamed protein product, partial [Rotaria socialis]
TRLTPMALQFLQCRQSIDLVHSNSSIIHQHVRQKQQQQQLLQPQSTCKTMNDVTYYFQRISNV